MAIDETEVQQEAVDPWEPRKNASKLAARRARTVPLTQPITPRADPAPQRPALKVSGGTIATIGFVLLIGLVGLWQTSQQARKPIVSASPTAPVAAAPSAAPVATVAPAVEMIPAYWSPNGEKLPNDVPAEPRTILGAQPGWVWLAIDGGGKVWVERGELLLTDTEQGTIAQLLTPPTQPPAAVVPVAPPPPEPCANYGSGNRVVRVCGWGDLAAQGQALWLQTYGGNLGAVSTPSPYILPTPTAGFYQHTPVIQPEFQDALIDDSKPNELACGGAPMCGGLTNAQAREIVNKQRADATAEVAP